MSTSGQRTYTCKHIIEHTLEAPAQTKGHVRSPLVTTMEVATSWWAHIIVCYALSLSEWWECVCVNVYQHCVRTRTQRRSQTHTHAHTRPRAHARISSVFFDVGFVRFCVSYTTMVLSLWFGLWRWCVVSGSQSLLQMRGRWVESHMAHAGGYLYVDYVNNKPIIIVCTLNTLQKGRACS